MSPGTKSARVCVVTRPVGKTESVEYVNIIFSNTYECCSLHTFKILHGFGNRISLLFTHLDV